MLYLWCLLLVHCVFTALPHVTFSLGWQSGRGRWGWRQPAISVESGRKGEESSGARNKSKMAQSDRGELVQRAVCASRSDACSAQHSVPGGGGEAATRRPARPIEPLFPFVTPLLSLFGVQIWPLLASQPLPAIGKRLSATAHSGMSLAPQ